MELRMKSKEWMGIALAYASAGSGGLHISTCLHVNGKRVLKVTHVHRIKVILILGIQTLLPRDW